MLEGEIPCFSDTVSSNKVLVSKSVVDKLSLKVGDKLYTYYLENTIRARRLAVVGIYQTNFTAFDDLFLLTDFYTVSRLNNWHEGNAGGLEIKISDYALLKVDFKQFEQLDKDYILKYKNRETSVSTSLPTVPSIIYKSFSPRKLSFYYRLNLLLSISAVFS